MMEMLAITSKFDNSGMVALAILPIIIIMAVLYWYEKRGGTPKFESLSSAQKAWLFLRFIDPGLAVKVFIALGTEVAWNYLKEANDFAPKSALLTGKVCDEFYIKAMVLPGSKVRVDYASITEFLIDNYHGNGALLAADLCKVWPLEAAQTSQPEQADKLELEPEAKTEENQSPSEG